MRNENKPNIFITRLASAYYGAEMYLVRIFRLIQNEFGNVILVTNQTELRNQFSAQIENSITFPFQWGREVHGWKSFLFFIITYPIYFLLWGMILFAFHWKYHIDVLFLQTTNEKLILPVWAKLLKLRVISIEHCSNMPFWDKIGIGKLFRLMEPLIDKVIFVNNSVEESFLQGNLFVKNHVVINNGIDLQQIDEELAKYDQLVEKQRLGFKKDAFILGYIGRIEQPKGTQYLVEAISVLKKRGIKVNAVFVGDGPGLASDKRLAQELGIVDQTYFFGGTTSPAWQVFKAADVWVHPTTFEGLSFVALESAAAAKATIASNISGLCDFYVHKKVGLLFAVGDVEDLADQIELLYSDSILRKQLGRAARKRVQKEYDLKKTAERTCDVLLENVIRQ